MGNTASPNSTTAASFVATREIIKRGKPFTDGDYMKESFINISEHLFADFKNKTEIIQKIKLEAALHNRVVTWCVILYRMHRRKNKHLIMKVHYVFVVNLVISIVG